MNIGYAFLIVTLIGVSAYGCSSKDKEISSAYQEPSGASDHIEKLEGEPLYVPSDPHAQFYVLDVAKKGSDSVIVTKRVGSSGVGYSTRLYNCQDSTVKYLGTGSTRQEMEQSNPDPNMAPIVEGSIAYYVGMEACNPQ